MNKRTFLLLCVLFQVLAVFVFMHYRNRLPSVSTPFPSFLKLGDENQSQVDADKVQSAGTKPRKHHHKEHEGAAKETGHKCGYEACYPTDPQVLNVHVVAHSHDDVGWLKTVDEYYYGRRQEIQKASVETIIDSVIKALEDDPKRKFIQVESAYLSMWWNNHKEQDHARLQKLINNGQIEIIGGAWSMNDEACTYYQTVIDQFTHGLKFLNETFGECARPKIGWQIDPFGHSREMASIFAQLGYDGYLLGRVDHRDKNTRLDTHTAEMIWQGSANLGKDSWIFSHILYNEYQAPRGFYFDILSNDEPLVADKLNPSYNLQEKMEKFTQFVSKQAAAYTSNNIILTMGMDFAYQNATYNYENLDTLIKAYEENVNNDSHGRRIKLFYSTPSCYIKSVNEYSTKNELGYVVKTDDFMPYADKIDRYWTGYYTSRPTLKRLERQGNNILQIAKQLAAFCGPMSKELTNNLEELKSAMGIMQHHDAVTGTEKQEVAKDYAKILTKAIDGIHLNMTEMLRKLFAKSSKAEDALDIYFQSCLLSNVSFCEPSQTEIFVVAVYNPLSYPVTYHVRLPVNSDNFVVVAPEGQISWQVVPTIDSFSYVEHINPTRFELVFEATNVPALGAKLYYIVDEGYYEEPAADITPNNDTNRLTLGDTNLGFTINGKTGLLETVTISGQTLPISQELMFYNSGYGSGAYIFKPDYETNAERLIKDGVSFEVYKGDVVHEVHQTFGKWAKQIIRVYNSDHRHIEFDWLVGPIDISDGSAKEVISRFVTKLNSSQEFYTDSNGREFLKRRINHRATYALDMDQPIAGNYYPINSAISIVDKAQDIEVGVITDRPQGGTSLKSGEIELMIHRRLLNDDGLGVSEALNETEFKGRGTVARGQHYLTFGTSDDGTAKRTLREISQQKIRSPWLFISETMDGLDQIEDKVHFEFSGIKKPMPSSQVQILTLEPWKSEHVLHKVLLRVEHTVEISEGGKDVMVDLKNFFSEFQVTSLQETTLAANQLLSDNDRLVWKANKCLLSLENCESSRLPDQSYRNKLEDKDSVNEFQIYLTPMEIRTFIMTVSYL